MPDPSDWLPNFFIIGAPKAATSSMHAWLAAHPDAFGSVEKETYFFVDPGTHMYLPDFNITNGLATYQAQFPIPEGTRPRIILEATPSYLYNEAALTHIPDLPTTPRCLVMLRDPAEQIYSLFTYFRDNWDWIPAEMTFAEFLVAARAGDHDFKGNELASRAFEYARYAEHLSRWEARLGRDRLMVVTLDALKNDQKALTQKIAAWIGLDPTFYEDYAFPRENETYAPRNRALQSVNIAIRGLLPKGRLYRGLRHLYRGLNTRKPDAPGSDDTALIRELKVEFAPDNARLAAAFGVDTHSWAPA